MRPEDRDELRRQVTYAADLGNRANAILQAREELHAAVEAAVAEVRSRIIEVNRDGHPTWALVPLTTNDSTLAVSLATIRDQPPMSPESLDTLEWLRGEVLPTSQTAAPLTRRRLFEGRKRFDPARAAAAALPAQLATATSREVKDVLDGLEVTTERPTPRLEALADSQLGLAERLGIPANSAELISPQRLTELPAAIETLDQVVSEERHDAQAARVAGERARDADVRRLLSAMSVDSLRQMATGTLLTRPFITAGIDSVQALLDHERMLLALPGVGEATARRAVGAALNLQMVTRQDTPLRIDIKTPSEETTELLTALRRWDACRRTQGAAADLQRAEDLRVFAQQLELPSDLWMAIPLGSTPVSTLLDSVDAITRRADVVRSASTDTPTTGDVWGDFLARPADYFALLAELGFVTEDAEKVHGTLPDEVVEAVRALELRTDHIRASLRGYQSFAARFALVQEKVIIGDEMGLGKTIEALATLAHLRSTGESHFLVVCPAAVVSNWLRETVHHTTLRPFRIHGPYTSRMIALRNWSRTGGVGVTTFDTLGSLMGQLERTEIACVVVDEAHYIKNPKAKRSQRTQSVIAASPRALLMSGTPLENRVEEFHRLINYIRPDLASTASDMSPLRFRRHVAPVYLRRNQEDVLTELPELIEVDEWLGMSLEDDGHYRDAVVEGNFAAMRRAAMLDPRSEKLARLKEIAAEARDNGRRVIVYSYFLDVLRLIDDELEGQAFGPLTGRVPANQRQDIIDAFSASEAGAILVSQIVAGGVGLNIQSASVVVICEPQLKPTTESQAIARAHRMGQVQSVQVHRLLSEDSVDERIREILARKKEVFDQFARESDMADAAPEAIDISEAEIAREVVTAERLRVLGAGDTGPDPEPLAASDA